VRDISDWYFRVFPSVSLIGGDWGGEKGFEYHLSQGLQITPPFSSWITGISLILEGNGGVGARYGYLSLGGRTRWHTRFTIRSRIKQWRELSVLYFWQWSRGKRSGESQVLPYNLLSWNLSLQFYRLPLLVRYGESIDRQFHIFSQDVSIQYSIRLWRGAYSRYTQLWGRTVQSGYYQERWDNKLSLGWQIYLLRIEGEAFYRWDFESKGWSWGYRIKITRDFSGGL